MDNFLNEMESFLKGSRYVEKTKRKYKKHLLNFASFLSEIMGDPIETIHLMRIYEVSVLDHVVYRPIDTKLIDQYLVDAITKGNNYFLNNWWSISSFFRYLQKNYDFPNILKESSISAKDYRIPPKPQRILSRHEILRFLHHLVMLSIDIKLELILYTLLISTGCRIKEILTLKTYNINFENNYILIEDTKNGHPHIIPLRKGIGEILKTYCLERSIDEESYLFIIDGKPLAYYQVRENFINYLDVANLPRVRIHSIRHSFATHLYENGCPITVIQQLLNHVFLSSTKTYIHPNYTRNKKMNILENEKLYAKLNKLKERHRYRH